MVKYQCGKGVVYTLTAFDYPGHKRLQQLSARITAFLAGESRGDIHVEDFSQEIFWNCRRESDFVARVNMLNTDWSEKGNVKVVTLFTPGVIADFEVKERQALMLTVLPFAVIDVPSGHFLEVVSADSGKALLRITRCGSFEEVQTDGKEICTEIEISK